RRTRRRRPAARRSERRGCRRAAPARLADRSSTWRPPRSACRLARRSCAPLRRRRFFLGRKGAVRVRVDLADLALGALARLAELVLELRELDGAVAHELELTVDVAERLHEQLAAAVRVDILAAQLRAHLRARLLGAK